MPRKSVASLSVVPRVPGRGPSEPPVDLDALESRIWREVVDALPGHWLDTAGQLILRRLAAQAHRSTTGRGLRIEVYEHAKLSFDFDRPEDYLEWQKSENPDATKVDRTSERVSLQHR